MRIAITGGIAEGKSTVMSYLRDLGHETGSADEVARDVFTSESVQEQLSRILGSRGPVEPQELRVRIAADKDIRRQVNRIMHPEILRRLMSSTASFVEVPLLFEAAMHPLFDRVWMVTCGERLQLERLAIRLGNMQVAKQMISTQLSSQVKAAFADQIIRTNESEQSVKELVRSAIEREFAK